MQRKILFIFPNTANRPEIPRAITILAGIGKQYGWQRDYFDLYCYEKEADSMQDRVTVGEYKAVQEDIKMLPQSSLKLDLQAKIDSYGPDIIAISFMSFEYEFFLSFWGDIKVPKDTMVIAGGVHAILKPMEVASTRFFDIVCIGEGEDAFDEILQRYPDKPSLSSISTTYFCDRETGQIKKNPLQMVGDEERLWRFVPDHSFFDDKYFLYPFDGRLMRLRVGAHLTVPTAAIQP